MERKTRNKNKNESTRSEKVGGTKSTSETVREIIKKLIDEQMEQDKAQKEELENCEKEREMELSNFHRIYAKKMKQQERKFVAEILQLNEDKKKDKEYQEKQENEYTELLQLVQEDRDYHEKQAKQLTEIMQGLVVVAQQEKMKHESLMKERESQHAKEIKELQKTCADQAKLSNEECRMMPAKIPTPKETQQENITKQQENRKKPQHHHQTTMKSSETYTVVAPVTIRERSMTFNEL